MNLKPIKQNIFNDEKTTQNSFLSQTSSFDVGKKFIQVL
jgi:hypothetical protein